MNSYENARNILLRNLPGPERWGRYPRSVSRPQIVAVEPDSPAEASGLRSGDEIVAIGGEVPRDVIRWQLLTDAPDVDLVVQRDGTTLDLTVVKAEGEPLGAEVSSAVFDRVQTCDNHCEFCFIYQLPKGMRRSLYLKDDDFRLSFLYGNFTTLTRFTELDFERVITERLSRCMYRCTQPIPKSGRASSRILEVLFRCGGCGCSWMRVLRCTDRWLCARESTTAPCSRTRWRECLIDFPS